MVYTWTALVGLDHTKSAPKIAQGVDLVHQAVPFASFHPVFQGRQHTFRPDAQFNPGPSAPDLSGPSSLFRHCGRLCFRSSFRHVSTFLPPLAPRPLRRFIATMEARTPIRLSHAHRSPCFTYSTFQTIPSPTTWRSPIALSRYVLPLSVTGLPVAFQRLSAYFPHGSRLHHYLAGPPESPGRNGFVIATDWSFASCCSPPRFTATQLQSATGCSVYLKRTCTSLIECACRRTGSGLCAAHVVGRSVNQYE